MKILVKTMEGIGDNLFLRPIIKQLIADRNQLWLKTPLPEFYADLPVKFVEIEPQYRTQKKNIERSRIKFVKEPKVDKVLEPFYGFENFTTHGLTGTFEIHMGYQPGSQPLKWDLPPSLEPHRLKLPKGQKIALVRPNVIRKEWPVPSRSCDNKHLLEASQVLRERGFYVISVADTVPYIEWIDQPEPQADLELHHGELSIPQVVSLIRDVDVVVGSPGFIMPAAICAGTPLITLWGGRGMYDCPENLLDPRMDQSKLVNLLPARFCRCRKRDHACDKFIPRLKEQMNEGLHQLVH